MSHRSLSRLDPRRRSALTERAAVVGVLVALSGAFGGCQSPDPVASFIQRQDSLPPDQRVPDWERTKRLMLRPAPAIGEPAPDFALATLDGARTIRMSEFREARPLVLIFGSFT
ncbi:MAG: hypothetical protein KF841_02160 [Phycisphaerae bacterium]|nr:hypothetical protein [Phycisphaerae bacterium]